MLKDNLEYKIIYSYVYYKGYVGNVNTLNDHIYKINKNNFPNNHLKSIQKVNMIYPKDVIIIKRTHLLKYILTINSKIKRDKIIKQYIEKIKVKYPIIDDIEQVFRDFHAVIMSDTPELVDQFIDIYEGTKINDFCQSIK